MVVGILALQGAFIEHKAMLDRLGVESVLVRSTGELCDIDGLIIPGGESTVMAKLLRRSTLVDELHNRLADGMPVFGTCAGMILLADRIEGERERYLGGLNCTVRRNAYGRQLESFTHIGEFADLTDIRMIFIRAPHIVKAGENVEVLSTVDGNIVAAQQNNILVTSFHPELTEDTRVHSYFLDMITDCNDC